MPAIIAEREKWPADRRNEDPLLFATHPDFVTFPPDGPLRQISIEQMRSLKERAQFKPLHGARRVFLIDHIDRANEQAANSLLKTLEEPPEHMILVLTAENPYDLLPTIRSRAVPFHLGRLSNEQMQAFVDARGLPDAERRIALAAGSPGLAVSIDLEAFDERRAAMLTLLKVAAGRAAFSEWVKHAEAIAPRKSEKLELFLGVLYLLLEDVLALSQGVTEIRNSDLRRDLETLARRRALRLDPRGGEKNRRNVGIGAAKYSKEHRAGFVRRGAAQARRVSLPSASETLRRALRRRCCCASIGLAELLN